MARRALLGAPERQFAQDADGARVCVCDEVVWRCFRVRHYRPWNTYLLRPHALQPRRRRHLRAARRLVLRRRAALVAVVAGVPGPRRAWVVELGGARFKLCRRFHTSNGRRPRRVAPPAAALRPPLAAGRQMRPRRRLRLFASAPKIGPVPLRPLPRPLNLHHRRRIPGPLRQDSRRGPNGRLGPGARPRGRRELWKGRLTPPTAGPNGRVHTPQSRREARDFHLMFITRTPALSPTAARG
mmetsp:Transcript_13343/g.44602  ORF Transcript_13343/g.44602 Transcript_13343/m.44602 type:complete len:241 (-) Transcript_13343:716-1438(-)